MTLVPVPVVLNEQGIRKYLRGHRPSGHDYRVQARINNLMAQKYAAALKVGLNSAGAELATVSYVLEQSQVPGAVRNTPGDTVDRDAEYYLKSRWVVARHKGMFAKAAEAIWMDAKNLGYNGLKAVLNSVGLLQRTKWLHADEGPLTPPGGVFWGWKGSVDGLKDNPDAHAMPAPVMLNDYDPSMNVGPIA